MTRMSYEERAKLYELVPHHKNENRLVFRNTAHYDQPSEPFGFKWEITKPCYAYCQLEINGRMITKATYEKDLIAAIQRDGASYYLRKFGEAMIREADEKDRMDRIARTGKHW